MSLETLLEAAEYLERNNLCKGDEASNAFRHSEPSELGQGGGGGHLRLDPNLPISFQFHTYTSLAPSQLNGGAHGGQAAAGGAGGARRAPRQNQSSAGRTKSASFSAGHRPTYQQQLGGPGLPVHRRGGRNASMSEGGCSSPAFTSSRHRELHKTLEKNRRAHLRSCFEQLKQELPKSDCSERKYSHINIIHYAIKYIQQLKQSDCDQQGELRRLSVQNQRYLDTMEQLGEQIICRLEHDCKSEPCESAGSSDSVDSAGPELHLSASSSSKAKHSDSGCSFSSRCVDHRRQMDQLLLQVERTLLCGSDGLALEPTGEDSDVCLEDEMEVAGVDEEDDDDDDAEELVDRLDDGLVDEPSESGSQQLICHQFVDESTSASAGVRSRPVP